MIAVKSKNRDPIKIAGVIVLYNPTIENLLNINSYIDALDLLYAIDNSEQPKTSVSDFLAKYKKVKYIPLNENAGIAYALNLAARNSIEEGFSHLLTMDQDSCADDNMMSELLNAAEIFSDAGIIAPVQMNKFNTQFNHTDKISIESTKTSGNILNLSIYELVGKFSEAYFIDYVDIEFCVRLKLKNYNIIEVGGARLFHNEANIERKAIFRKTFYVYNHNPVRIYYKTRNLLYFHKEYKVVNKKVVKIELNFFIKNTMKMLLFEKGRLQKLKYLLRGVLDYFNNKKYGLQ